MQTVGLSEEAVALLEATIALRKIRNSKAKYKKVALVNEALQLLLDREREYHTYARKKQTKNAPRLWVTDAGKVQAAHIAGFSTQIYRDEVGICCTIHADGEAHKVVTSGAIHINAIVELCSRYDNNLEPRKHTVWEIGTSSLYHALLKYAQDITKGKK